MRIILFNYLPDKPCIAFLVEPPTEETFGIAILEQDKERVIVDFYDYVPYSLLMWELM